MPFRSAPGHTPDEARSILAFLEIASSIRQKMRETAFPVWPTAPLPAEAVFCLSNGTRQQAFRGPLLPETPGRQRHRKIGFSGAGGVENA